MNRLLNADEDGSLAKCACGSNRGTLEDCTRCNNRMCSECAQDGLCRTCVVERLNAAMADETDADEDAALGLIAQALAHRVVMMLQADLAEVSVLAQAGCTPAEARAAMARNREAN